MAEPLGEEGTWLDMLTRANWRIAEAYFKHTRGEGPHPLEACPNAYKRREVAQMNLAGIRKERLLERKRKASSK